MALKEVPVCPAGHDQGDSRKDRPGRCTYCGAVLVRGLQDGA